MVSSPIESEKVSLARSQTIMCRAVALSSLEPQRAHPTTADHRRDKMGARESVESRGIMNGCSKPSSSGVV